MNQLEPIKPHKPKRFTKEYFVRKFRAFIAFMRNTFVTDCPNCHKHFYGFHKHGTQIKIKDINYRILCHRCFYKEKIKWQTQ